MIDDVRTEFAGDLVNLLGMAIPTPSLPRRTIRLADCCKPFDRFDAELVRALMRPPSWSPLPSFPALMADASLCDEVQPVWEAYLDGTSAPFQFNESAGSCVAASARRDTGPRGSAAAADHAEAVKSIFDLIMAFLPETLTKAPPPPFSFPLFGRFTEIRLPLVAAVGPAGEPGLHVDITYGNPSLNAAGQLAGGTGRDGNGSDRFGDDDRIMSGSVIITVTEFDAATGAMSGEARWRPHVRVKDTVDFCPGNMGGIVAQQVTVPLSRLEASGLAKDVPISIDYDLEVQTRRFDGLVPRRVDPPPVPLPRRKRPPGPNDHPCR